MPLRTVTVTRYVTPLREGGSLPAVVEADDDGLYVLKFRGAGQGASALVAELIGGELARALGLPVPELVFAQLDADIARTEPDPEIQELIRASGGLNLALDYLPGSLNFDPLAMQPDAALASSVVWFDAFISNLDRTARNTNLLVWHRGLWLIDHGAALYFHHQWDGDDARADQPFALIADHVLLPFATQLAAVDDALAERLSDERLQAVLAEVPADWLGETAHAAEARRTDYLRYLRRRLRSPRAFVQEALRAHAAQVGR
ncbi:HipA family kinase [Aquabacterium sp. J223]|uniref:HipA family kinase n=1 Tax=Aquabacterium sp. J223 TaxID=2898431 RepID=UPI0021ADD527|nr:HipA family kinase [Aquabacterium sp. J223]UUX95506.1 aminotransferase class I and II [Aquabacterium sp. J223]